MSVDDEVQRRAVLFHDAIDHGPLRVFVAVAEERSFSRAADRLYLAQPWLSTQVRSLEARIGLRLFERSSHHVELTPAARTLLPLAKDVLIAMDAAVAATVSAAAGTDAHPRALRLGAPSYTVFLRSRVEALERFEAARPASEIAIDSDSTSTLMTRLRDGRLDAAFLLTPIDSDGLRTLAFAQLPMLLQIPTDHPLAAHEAVELHQLARQRVATWRRDVHPDAFERTYGPIEAAGAELVPMEGLVVDGIAEAAAGLGLLSTASSWTRTTGTVLRPLHGVPPSTIVLAAAADEATWSDELRTFWAIATELAA
jgi:DNA-binding transcriptional LysR family regulator